MLCALAHDLKAAGVTLILAGLKKPVREALDRAGLDKVIGTDYFFASKDIALRALEARFVPGTRRRLPL